MLTFIKAINRLKLLMMSRFTMKATGPISLCPSTSREESRELRSLRSKFRKRGTRFRSRLIILRNASRVKNMR